MRTGCRQALAVNNRDFFFFTVLSFRILAYVFSWGIQGAAKYFVGKGITKFLNAKNVSLPCQVAVHS